MSAALRRFRELYDQFSPQQIARVEEIYAPTFAFRDPFHTISADYVKLRAYFTRVLTALDYSKFITEDEAVGADGAYVRWRWEWKRKPHHPIRSVPGVTHLRFAADERILEHHDLFDAAEGFYETLPVVGGILRSIKRRL
ncbi:hypothetical protein BH11MYX2_BH11MYX2_41360 [soil metagenome]